MSKQAVIDAARADLRYTENPPGSNMTKYGEAYGMNGEPWCVEALWYWFNEAGERMAFFGGGKTASCGMLLRWYKEQGLTVPVEDVREGDIVILNFSGTKETQHCGLVVETYGDAIFVIEGNTSPGLEGSQNNGGCVALKQRNPSQIVGVCRPQYKPDDPQIVPDYTGRWSQKYWEKGIALGIIDEAKDGKYRPKDNATREEVLAMILRNNGYRG
nr:S-layer homology domain-containing protein [Clostridia bacterium]